MAQLNQDCVVSQEHTQASYEINRDSIEAQAVLKLECKYIEYHSLNEPAG